MYQYPGQYGQPPGYGAYMGSAAPPPGMSPPPGMTAPPGTNQVQQPLPPRPGGFPPNFQPPPNMPNINFSAPVIRLGTAGPPKESSASVTRSNAEPLGNRRGLGMDRGGDQQRHQARDTVALIPPSREEMMRTIFVGDIPKVLTDSDLERIAAAAGNLRRWTRAIDADNKPCPFGFAEYEDAESLETAIEVLQNVEVPAEKIEKNDTKDGDVDKAEEKRKARLLVKVDELSVKYSEEWREKRNEDEAAAHFRVDSAREALSRVLYDLFNPPDAPIMDLDGDTKMQEMEQPDPVSGEVITIPLSAEDELSDIPAEMRETVAAEIAAFRERSNRRDMERLRREEELEAAEKRGRINRLASPPPLSTPTGPAGGANGIPVGPRDRGIQGAPSGPRGYQGAQPKDYQNGVAFVNGIHPTSYIYITPAEEDTETSDTDLESRRKEKRDADQEKAYLDYERRWLNRERSRAAAIEREKLRDKDDTEHLKREKLAMAARLKEWNDDAEGQRKAEEYYRDRSQWLRNRTAFRSREADIDERDRQTELRERARDQERRDQARGLADSFLERQAQELGARQAARDSASALQQAPHQRLKISLGAAAAQRAQAAAAAAGPRRRAAAEVEGLLEDEEDAESATKRTLKPIKFDSAAEAAGLSEEERQQAIRQLAAEIPVEKGALWAWDVKWEFVDEGMLAEQLRPFVEKKIVEYLGVQEQMLVEVVEEHLKKRGGPDELIGELEGPLDEEAEVLVKKLWRMLIFYSESEKRGLSG